MDPFNWNCPYCNRAQTVNENNFSEGRIFFSVGETSFGDIGIEGLAVRCTNPTCIKPTVIAAIKSYSYKNGSRSFDDEIFRQRLLPENMAKPQPDYIPSPIREDYEEACKIRDLSPKASATLSRRCLQGMIRDFCNISRGRLIDEINALKKQVGDGQAPKGVSEDSVEAIDHVRKIGNIGAHMEKDINLIIPVEPEEAQILIDLIESLFEEWYVARHKREEKFAAIKKLASDKVAIKTEESR